MSTAFGRMRGAAAGMTAFLAVALAASALPSPGSAAVAGGTPPAAQAEGERLGAAIQRALRAEGPLFTAEERALVERACGYPAGSWDGFSINMQGDTLVCADGRRVDDPEVRSAMRAAGPRIARRVNAAMATPEVTEAIAAVARAAEAEALRALEERRTR